MKYAKTDCCITASWSLPSRERGLKSRWKECLFVRRGVAPFTGAWIEIFRYPESPVQSPVAPFTGAWIEIARNQERGWLYVSLPSRERGLKSVPETRPFPRRLSLPSRERGLKSHPRHYFVIAPASLPSRERGLKCSWTVFPHRNTMVAPFVGAWIEI